MTDTVRVHPDDPVGHVAPAVHGHFVEHLGRCVYGGLWVGDDDRVETVDGVRTDSLDLLAALDPPVVRWPGGCFADDYDWTDGVGPRAARPRRRNLWWAQGRAETFEESNAFGTEEFLRVCRALDAAPYLAGNVGTGSPDELLDWVEYCNYDGDTEYTRLRAESGHEDPHDVRWWGVGNENWGCGGDFAPDEYARQYRRFANHLDAFERKMRPDRDLELVGCGHVSEGWNREFLAELGDADRLDHLSVHRYLECGDDADFTDDQYFRLLARARQVGTDVDRAAAAVDTYAPGADVGVVVDEWGVWHPQAVDSNGLEQANTVRDALVAADVLHQLYRRADRVTMANLAQAVNVLQCVVQTDAEAAWPTPTYRVFEQFRPHAGATALRTVVDTASLSFEGEAHDLPLVSASASRSEDGLFVSLSNRSLDEERAVRVDAGLDETPAVDASVLFADLSVEDYSTRATADAFAASPLDAEAAADGTVTVAAPPHSVVTLAVGD
ncbi:MAG: alpha-N-arabinofuranosidase [Halobacteriaceae archaeon]